VHFSQEPTFGILRVFEPIGSILQKLAHRNFRTTIIFRRQFQNLTDLLSWRLFLLLNCSYYHRLEVVDEALADTWAQLLVSMCSVAVGKFDLGTWLVSIVRWVPHLVRFLPVGAFDVDSLYTDRLVPLILVLSTQNQVTNAAFNILPVVLPCCSALLHGRD
jgi:hypothetical protein